MRKDIKKHEVTDHFDNVAGTYDLLQKLNPGYTRHLRMSADRLSAPPGGVLLDLCCGTGLSTTALRDTYPDARINGVDGSCGMLDVARERGIAGPIDFREADVMKLKPEDLPGPYDGILMAYGIRNMSDPDTVLANVLRLLKPGGTVCFHEYSVADSAWRRFVWNFVSLAVIIPLGSLTSPGEPLYRYLRRSVNEFDGVERFTRRLRESGFTNIRVEPMNGWAKGIVHSFLARRPE